MKETIKLTVRLFLITAIAGFVLAFANSFTSPVIKAREKAQYEAALKEVFADADKFVEVYQSESKGKFLVPGRYDLQISLRLLKKENLIQ